MIPKDLYPWNFLALDANLSEYATARAVVLPVPYEATVSYGAGTRLGPQAIIAASRQVETYDLDSDREPCSIGIATLGELQQDARGPTAMATKIEQAASGILSDGKFLLTLGGEHTISYPLIKAHKNIFPGISVLQIDAHTDLRDEYQGTNFSHACVMSRVSELCDVVQVGIRSFCGSRYEKKARQLGRIITSAEFHKNPDSISKILSMLADNVYITVDLDGFDPSIMPAVGTPEPGGLLWDETLELIKAIGMSKQIAGADIVELAPIPGLSYPDFAAARLAYKIIGYAFEKRD
jgi:agmatinase